MVTDLQVVPGFTTNLTQTICDGDSFFVAGAFRTVAGTYVDSLTTAAGCDSLVVTDLQVVPGFTTNLTQTIYVV